MRHGTLLARPLAVALALCAPAAVAVLAPPAALAADPVKTDERRTPPLLEAFAGVARKVAPSVVEVRTAAGDDLGFGVAVDDGTYVLTNASMLDATGENHVAIRSGRGFAGHASILARNDAYDVALLRLQTRGAKIDPVPLGRSTGLAVGQWVVTVGTLEGRPLAVGVVSALGRRVEPRAEAQAFDLFGLFSEANGPRRAYARVIQHDSPIDGDKHGAPLVDAEGRLVGINVANAYRGSSYAAPIDDIGAFLGELKAGRPGPPLPKPGFIGVSLGSIASGDIAKKVGVAGPGVQIHAATPGLPASKAGLRAGDVVLKLDGEKVASAERFGQIVRGTAPGSKLRILVLREGKDEVEVTVDVVERPADE